MNYICRDKNDPEELYQYGQLLYKGIKIRRNKAMAAQYFKASADKGNLNAMLKYARMLSKGDGISQNKEESTRYFKMAKEKRIQNSKMYRPYKSKGGHSQKSAENNPTASNYQVHSPTTQYHQPSPRYYQNSIQDSEENQTLDNFSQTTASTSTEQTTQYQPTSQLPSIHKKNQNKPEKTIEKPPPSKLPPIKKPIKMTESQEKMLKSMKRLPTSFVPIHYDLFLHIPSEKKWKLLFESSLTVTFQKNEDSDFCYLNVSSDIEIKSVIQADSALNYIVYYPILMIFRSNFDLSDYPITINYTVKPSLTDTKGFISSQEAFMTSFEPNYARNFMPCFDEPFLLSTFQVTLRIPSNLTGLSNMPVESVTDCGDEKELVFQTTPPIPTYFLSVFVGGFKVIEKKMDNGIPLKIYAMKINNFDYSKMIKACNYAVDWIESNFRVNLELPHLQLVFHSSIKTMNENYCLLSFSDNHLLESPDFIMSVIHGIIKHWFGCSITIKWWDSLWLNEGFCSFLQYLIYQDFDTENYIWDNFTEKRSIKSLKYYKNGLICQQQDSLIVFEKGCFVMKMFYDLIGRFYFFKVCSKWLNQFKNKAVEISDFTSLIKNELTRNYALFFNSWIFSVGFPTLFIDEIIDENDQNNIIGINIKQSSKSNDLFMFKVPILYELNGHLKKFDLLIDKEITTKFVQFDWIIVNDDIQSLCFVVYSNFLLKKLVALDEKKKLSNYNSYLISVSKKSQNPVSFFRSNEK